MKSLRSSQTEFQNPDYIQVSQKDTLRHKYLIILGALLVVSALFGFSIHTTYFKGMNFIVKIPIFSCLGISTTFALSVSIIDIVNASFHLIQSKDSAPPINSSRQVWYIANS
jgi:hypothetical protein